MNKQRGGKRKLKLCVFVASAMCLCAPAVNADYEISYAGGNNPFVISGKTDIAKQNQTVTLRVKDEEGNTLYIKQNMTDTDGSYSFTFDIGKDGKADVLLLEEDKVAGGQKQIYKSSVDEFDALIKRLNSNSEDIGTVISEEAELLGVDIEEFNDLKTNSVFLKYLDKQTYEDLIDFSDAYRIGKFLVMVNRNESVEEIANLGNSILAEADLDQRNAGEVFSAMSDAEKEKIYKQLSGKKYDTLDAFYDALCEKVILKEIEKADNYSDIYSVISDNNDYIGLDLDSVSKLGYDKEDFKKDFASSVSASGSIDDIKKKFNDLYKTYKDDSSGGGSGGSSGGGSRSSSKGGSGGSSSYQVNSDILPDITYPERSYFKDLDGYDWAKEAIVALASKGIVRGREDLIFVPGDNITRAEFVKIITEAFTLPENEGVSPEDFADVPKDFWGYDYIMKAKKTDIVKGVSETEFAPQGYITRQDMAVICRRVLSELKKDLTSVRETYFADDETISSYAKDSVYDLANAGIVNGKGNSLFDPFGCATRAEAAQMVYGILKAID